MSFPRQTRLHAPVVALAGALAVLVMTSPSTAAAAGDSGLPVPRFVSLGDDEVNARAGPGFRYPVEWVFKRDAMPVEVVEEYEDWRRVRDVEGIGGWVHRRMLSGRRGVVITARLAALRAAPNSTAESVARAEAGVQGVLKRCQGTWCLISIAGHDGWIDRDQLWGVYPEERWD